MDQRFVQELLPLGLGHLVACPYHGATLRARASPIGTRPPILKATLRARASPTRTWPPCSLLLPWNNASRKSVSHWDSATLQLAPPIEQRFAQEPVPLGLGHLAACPSHGSTLHARAFPTGTRPLSVLQYFAQSPPIELDTIKNKARRPHKCSPRTLWDLIYLPEFQNRSKIS
ncbi:hypothetical protein Adt_45177 [Abeliophyllum distichum]|uniref:Uncharacterized protein n=1 Tax=Abeliophyllum distichum TaxID=126358 RepID=A0ABD1PD38_9LAMI